MAKKKVNAKQPFADLSKEHVEHPEKGSYDPYAARIKGLDPANPNQYVLMVSQPGPFAMRNLLFMVDKLQVHNEDSNSPTVTGYDPEGKAIISFPVGYQYILFHKDMCDMVRWSEANQEPEEEPQGAKTITKVGQYL